MGLKTFFIRLDFLDCFLFAMKGLFSVFFWFCCGLLIIKSTKKLLLGTASVVVKI